VGPGRNVRGGAWNNNRRNLRCAYRNRNTPDNFNNNIGFRVVSHDSPSQPVIPVIPAMQDGAEKESQHCLFPVEGGSQILMAVEPPIPPGPAPSGSLMTIG
jgi:hypothetical protein